MTLRGDINVIRTDLSEPHRLSRRPVGLSQTDVV
jgi:hypothetical protein